MANNARGRRQVKWVKLPFLALVAGLLTVACNAFADEGISLTTALRGEDGVGTGVADIEISSDRTRLCWDITGLVGSVDDVTAMHIHSGTETGVGPVVVEFISGTQGCTEVSPGGVTESALRDIADRPANFYVDVHSKRYPDGAVRGQLERSGGGR